MDREKQRTGEDKDLLIQRANKRLTEKGFEPLFQPTRFSAEELRETIKMISDHSFSSKDKIVLHFNKITMNDTRQFSEHVATHKFPTKQVAHFFIQKVLERAMQRVPEPSRKWKGPDRLLVNDWIIITADGTHLEDIMDTGIDKKYKLPPPYDAYAESIMSYHWGSHPQINAHDNPGSKLSAQEREQYAPPHERPKALETKRIAHNKGEKKEHSAPVKKSGDTVSIAEICAALKIDAKEARGALRKINYEKPGSSWEWDKSKADKVKADIKNAVEKARKK